MKEASGELSMTAVAVVAIAAIGVLFTTLIWPNIKGALLRNQRCSSATNCVCATADAARCTCQYIGEDGKVVTNDTVECDNPNKSTTADSKKKPA